MITKEELKKNISELEISGKDVWINSSLRSFGDSIEGGADGLLDAFLEEGCTVMAPSFNWGDQMRPDDVSFPERNATDDTDEFNNRKFSPELVFDRNSNRMDADLGIFPNTLVKRRGRVRGGNAITAFAAVGPDAHYLLDEQDDMNPYIPFERLCENGGKALLIGVPLINETMIHLAEQSAGRRMLIRWVFNADGSSRPVIVSSCSNGFGNFSGVLAPVETQRYVGKSLWRCFPADELIRICREEIKKNPMITRCSKPYCAWCRDMIQGGPLY